MFLHWGENMQRQGAERLVRKMCRETLRLSRQTSDVENKDCQAAVTKRDRGRELHEYIYHKQA